MLLLLNELPRAAGGLQPFLFNPLTLANSDSDSR
jgi:hypothetical protein